MSEPKAILLERLIPTSPDAAWSHWTDEAKLASWLCERARVEPQIGGAYELFWDIADPNINSTIGCSILALEEPALLTFSWKGPAQFAGIMNDPPATRVTVRLKKQDEGTRILLLHTGWGEGEHWDEARTWFEAVWSGALDRLVSSAAGKTAESVGDR